MNDKSVSAHTLHKYVYLLEFHILSKANVLLYSTLNAQYNKFNDVFRIF